MFSVNSNLKIGHRIEKAYDIVEYAPFTMTLVPDVDNAVHIITDTTDIYVTPDTRLLTARGVWKRANKLQQGEQLKGLSCNTKIVNLVKTNKVIDVFCVHNTDYIWVNGLCLDC